MNDNKIWINQNLLFYKDVEFNTDSILDVSITSSTSDFITFSSIALNISVSSFSSRKNQMLNLQNTILIREYLLELENVDLSENIYKIQPDRIFIFGKKKYLDQVWLKEI